MVGPAVLDGTGVDVTAAVDGPVSDAVVFADAEADDDVDGPDAVDAELDAVDAEVDAVDAELDVDVEAPVTVECG